MLAAKSTVALIGIGISLALFSVSHAVISDYHVIRPMTSVSKHLILEQLLLSVRVATTARRRLGAGWILIYTLCRVLQCIPEAPKTRGSGRLRCWVNAIDESRVSCRAEIGI